MGISPPGFEPQLLQLFKQTSSVGKVNARSLLSAWRARLAQSVEHGTLNPRVVGSSPTLGVTFAVILNNTSSLECRCNFDIVRNKV